MLVFLGGVIFAFHGLVFEQIKPLPSRSLTTNAPEKIPKPNRKVRDRLPFPPFFRGKLAVKLPGCIWENIFGSLFPSASKNKQI